MTLNEGYKDIPCDVSCTSCGYNLRRLAPHGRCPECGQTVVRTVMSMSTFATRHQAKVVMALRDQFQSAAARAANVDPPASDLVLTGLARAGQVFEGRPIDAAQICIGVLDVALEYHGRDALQVLQRLGLESTETIGRVVFALAEYGFLEPEPHDSLADFVGLPAMSELWRRACDPKHDWYERTKAKPLRCEE